MKSGITRNATRHRKGINLDVDKNERWIATLTMFTVALVPSVAFAASSYWSTLDYTVALRGATRAYTGAHMHISLTSHESLDTNINTHKISLYRDRNWPISDDYIGFVNVPREGASGTKTWSNVGSANYYFYFSKANDGVRITSSNVHMWSDG